MRNISVLELVLLVAIGFAGRSFTHPGYLSNVTNHQLPTIGDPESHPRLFKRDSEAICTLALFNSLQKDGFDVKLTAFTNGTLRKRDMTLPGAGQTLNDYVMKETADDRYPIDPTMRRLHWSNPDTGLDVNTAEFRAFGEQQFGYNLVGLVGCTGMVILSKKGVYIAHYWENIAFDQDPPNDGNPRKHYATQNIAFAQTVRRGLTMGVGKKNQFQEQDSLKAVSKQIDDDSIHGFLMIPRTGPSATGVGVDDPYRVYWNQIKDIVGKILPRLDPKDDSRWTEYRYNPRQAEEVTVDPISGRLLDPLFESSRGRMLFKFDPNHQGKKKTLLIFEDVIQEAGSWEWT